MNYWGAENPFSICVGFFHIEKKIENFEIKNDWKN